MTKILLKECIDSEFENIQTVISELEKVVLPRKNVYSTVELAAIATFLHNFYNGAENILKRIFVFQKLEIKPSPTWHKDLLEQAEKIGIISSALHDSLMGFLSFRHFFVHSYCFSLKWDQIAPLASSGREVSDYFINSVSEYLKQIES